MHHMSCTATRCTDGILLQGLYFNTLEWNNQFKKLNVWRFNYRVRHLTFICQLNGDACVYAWATLGSGPAIDLQKMPVLAKKIWSLFWSLRETKLSHLGHRKTRTHPKRVAVWCGFWSRGIIGLFFTILQLITILPVNNKK